MKKGNDMQPLTGQAITFGGVPNGHRNVGTAKVAEKGVPLSQGYMVFGLHERSS